MIRCIAKYHGYYILNYYGKIKFLKKRMFFLKNIGIEDMENFEANSISPGTDFLFKLCQSLKAKVQELLETEWKGLHVLYSDCCVPGEG